MRDAGSRRERVRLDSRLARAAFPVESRRSRPEPGGGARSILGAEPSEPTRASGGGSAQRSRCRAVGADPSPLWRTSRLAGGPKGPAATATRGLRSHPPVAMTKAPMAQPCARSAHAAGGALRHAASGARARLRLCVPAPLVERPGDHLASIQKPTHLHRAVHCATRLRRANASPCPQAAPLLSAPITSTGNVLHSPPALRHCDPAKPSSCVRTCCCNWKEPRFRVRPCCCDWKEPRFRVRPCCCG
jgi:hypothetical protein